MLTLEKQFAETEEKDLAAAWEQYATVLRRADKPEAGDLDTLRESAEALGLKATETRRDLRDLASIAELRAAFIPKEKIDEADQQQRAEAAKLADEMRAAIIERLKTADLRLLRYIFDQGLNGSLDVLKAWDARMPAYSIRANMEHQNATAQARVDAILNGNPRVAKVLGT